jgi:hypothetical protein
MIWNLLEESEKLDFIGGIAKSNPTIKLHHPKLTLIKTAIHFVTKLTSCTN